MNKLLDDSGPKGIPKAKFLETVEDFVVENNTNALTALLQELHNKYRFMESSFRNQRQSYEEKIPDIKQALATVGRLVRNTNIGEEFPVWYCLSDNIYAEATVTPDTDKVNLWLGANVMMEYNHEEAKKLLTTHLQVAEEKVEEYTADLDFLKEQLTTTEVNLARVHNYAVYLRSPAGQKKTAEAVKA